MFKSELRAQEKVKLRRLEAYFTTMEDHFKNNLQETLKSPPGIDFDQWNPMSTNCTYVKRNVSKDWLEWMKMASSG